MIYARISKDDRGDHLGVDRQERLCRQLASQRGLDVVEVLVDNDISAYRAKRRPGFERLVEMLKAGEVAAVLIYHVDRLYRRMADLERLVEIVEVTGAQVHTVAAGDVDMSSASGRMVARMIGAAAQHESERLSERSRVKNDELASRGRPPGGRPPYGYAWATQVGPGGGLTRNYVVVPEEADALRRMARRVLEGASLLAIARELDAAGVATREGRPWHSSTVRAVLLNPAPASLRVHRREVAGPGDWEPVLDRGTWEEVRAVLADPARKRTRPARRYLLAGLVRNTNGDPLNGHPDHARQPTYATQSPAKPSLSIDAGKLEALVVEAVLCTLDQSPLPLPGGMDSPSAGVEVTRLNAELDELAALRGRGTITLAEWMAARAPLQQRLEDARRAAGVAWRPPGRAARLLVQPGAVRQAWPELDLAAKREILVAVLDRIVVSPAKRGRWTPTVERVDLTWRA